MIQFIHQNEEEEIETHHSAHIDIEDIFEFENGHVLLFEVIDTHDKANGADN